MGGSSGGSSQPVEQTVTQTQFPEEAKPYYSRLLSRGEAESLQPYAAFPSQRLAEFAPEEQQAFGMTRQLAMQGTPFAQRQAEQTASQIAQGRPFEPFTGFQQPREPIYGGYQQPRPFQPTFPRFPRPQRRPDMPTPRGFLDDPMSAVDSFGVPIFGGRDTLGTRGRDGGLRYTPKPVGTGIPFDLGPSDGTFGPDDGDAARPELDFDPLEDAMTPGAGPIDFYPGPSELKGISRGLRSLSPRRPMPRRPMPRRPILRRPMIPQRPMQQKYQSPMERYMTPYQQGVTDIAKEQAIRDANRRRSEIGLDAASQGALGGYREGIVESNLNRDLLRNLSDIQTRGLQSGFESAQQQFERDRAARMAQEAQQLSGAQLLGGFAPQAQQMALERIGALGGVGGQRRGFRQAGLDIGYEDFLRQEGYPRRQIGFQSDIIRGLQLQPSQTVSSYAQRPGLFQQTLGAGLGALGLYQGMGGGRRP